MIVRRREGHWELHCNECETVGAGASSRAGLLAYGLPEGWESSGCENELCCIVCPACNALLAEEPPA